MHRKNTFIRIKKAFDLMINNIHNGEIDDEVVFQTCNALIEAVKLIENQNSLIQKMGGQIGKLRINLKNCQNKIVLLKRK